MAFNAIPQGGIINFYESVPFDRKHAHVRDFKNEQERTEYLDGKKLVSINNVSYIRNDSFKVQLPISQLKYCNYCSFVNEGFDFKKYYAFITDIKYINNETTEVTIDIDNFQTWLFQYDILPCWVQREHVLDDTVGLHTVAEDFKIPDLISYNSAHKLFTDWNVVIMYAPNNFLASLTFDGGSVIHGIYSGAAYETLPLSATVINEKINDLIKSNQTIVNMYMCPSDITDSGDDTYYLHYDVDFQPLNEIGYQGVRYTIKNNKLLTYPYQRVRMYNGKKNQDYAFEYFNAGTPSFTIRGSKMNMPSLYAYPSSYLENFDVSRSYGYTAGLEINDFPVCTWGNNGFLEYTGLGAIESALKTIGYSSGLGLLGGITSAAGGIASGVVGTVTNITSSMFEPIEIKGGSTNGYLDVSTRHLGFSWYHLAPKPEVLQMWDRFLTIYGYRVNEWKKPNLRGRTLFNYVKTVDAIIGGNIPQDAIEDFETWFNNGITIWHTEIGTEGDNEIE